MLILIALIIITPVSDHEISLPWEFNRIVFANKKLYFSSYAGSNIYFFQNESLKALTIGDDPLFIIENFHFSPFFLFLTDGQKIIKHYLQQSLSETIYQGNSITSFCLLESGDIAILDRKPDQVIILDRQYRIRIKITDFPARDIATDGSKIYILSKKDLIITDHHLNIIKKVTIPETMKKIIVADDRIIIYTPGKRQAYYYNQDWQKVTFDDYLQDIALDGDRIYVLAGYGNIIRIYNFSDF